MEGENCVNGSIIDEFQSWDIQVDKAECENGLTRSIIDDFHFSDIQ